MSEESFSQWMRVQADALGKALAALGKELPFAVLISRASEDLIMLTAHTASGGAQMRYTMYVREAYAFHGGVFVDEDEDEIVHVDQESN